MSWFKRQIDKLFNNEIEEEDYYDETEYDEEEQAPATSAEEINHTGGAQKKSFKFPLIADEEMNFTGGTDRSDQGQQNRFEHRKADSRHFYQQNAISKVFDVEVSGIHELLEKRQRIKGSTKTYSARQDFTKRRRKDQASVHVPTQPSLKKAIEQPIKKKTEEDILIPKRRFVPTQVPSPVYGFKKPSNIDDLLAKKQQESMTHNGEINDELNSQHGDAQQPEKKADPVYKEVQKVKEEIASIIEAKEKDEALNEETSHPQIAAASTALMEKEEMPEHAPEIEKQAPEIEKQNALVEEAKAEELVVEESSPTPALAQVGNLAELEENIEQAPIKRQQAQEIEKQNLLVEEAKAEEMVEAESSPAPALAQSGNLAELEENIEQAPVEHQQAQELEKQNLLVEEAIAEELVEAESSPAPVLAQGDNLTDLEEKIEQAPIVHQQAQEIEKQNVLVEEAKAEELMEAESSPAPAAMLANMTEAEVESKQMPNELREAASEKAEEMQITDAAASIQVASTEVIEHATIPQNVEVAPKETVDEAFSMQKESTIDKPIALKETEDLASIESEQVRKLASIALDGQEYEESVMMDEQDAQENPPEIKNEELEEKPPEIKNEELEEKPQSKGSKLPFNVLMLKSDKEKYAAKLAQKQTPQHNDVIKEFTRHPSTTGIFTNREAMPKPQHASAASATAVLEPAVEEPVSIDAVDPVQLEKDSEQPAGNSAILEENIEQPVVEQVDEPKERKPLKLYTKPSFEFLLPPEEKTEDHEWLESQGDVLVESLSYFQVTAQVESITQGPAVTQFEITVSHGTKVSKIRNLADDLKLALAAKDIRIQAPIPGKSTIGIEIPNRIASAVRLSEVTCSDSFIESESPLEAALGLDLTGKPVTIDLRKMPHGLIAGATGSGKSVCINSILVSLLYKANPNELKLMLIDPKMVELAPFNHIPHLVSPVITDVKAATAALKWAVEEMEKRYQLFAHAGVRDLPRFNKLAESKGEYGHKLPYILIVIDELADLMMMSPADVEEAICRIAQKARACGIHLIVATQRPSVDVITGLIKSNIPTRIAFAVSSQVDSRTILDSQGAERLLGRGDMLFLGNGMSAPIRLQGTFVTDDEIEAIIEHVREQGEPDYIFEQDELLRKTEMVEEQDELFEDVCRFVYEQGSASTSSIQRKYHIGYNRAARLMDMLESQGFISEQRGSKPREVFITDSDLSNMFE